MSAMAEIDTGSTVRLNPETKPGDFAFGFGGVPYESVGTVLSTTRIKSIAIHTVFFPEHEHWLGISEELQLVDQEDLVKVEDIVCLKLNTQRPRYNWGKVSLKSVGKVRETHANGNVIVDFEEQRGWKGLQCELRRRPENFQEEGKVEEETLKPLSASIGEAPRNEVEYSLPPTSENLSYREGSSSTPCTKRSLCSWNSLMRFIRRVMSRSPKSSLRDADYRPLVPVV